MDTKIFLVSMALLLGIPMVIAGTSSQFTVYWSVANSYDHTISYDSNCSGGTAYFVEHDALVDGNGWKLFPYDDGSRTNLCQGRRDWYFQVSITGTATTELDINVSDDQSEDVNLKVYEAGYQNGCGWATATDTNCTGWEMPCSISDGQVTNVACLQAGTADGEFASLASGADMNFCMCADFAANGTQVNQGDHVETVGITSRAAD